MALTLTEIALQADWLASPTRHLRREIERQNAAMAQLRAEVAATGHLPGEVGPDNFVWVFSSRGDPLALTPRFK
jgi:hypothetical protein